MFDNLQKKDILLQTSVHPKLMCTYPKLRRTYPKLRRPYPKLWRQLPYTVSGGVPYISGYSDQND